MNAISFAGNSLGRLLAVPRQLFAFAHSAHKRYANRAGVGILNNPQQQSITLLGLPKRMYSIPSPLGFLYKLYELLH
jgi:hypothetical protein